ncbi:hypothetical protein ACFQQB_27730 [Nonomuraea rubra]|uniref:hypothetical protein n=1 Tax=Nonomuraea rubra TaxID=46180 RepID=UPI00360E0DD2
MSEDDVQEYRRKRLEPEIAAMSVEIDEDDEHPTVIVNIDDPTAKGVIKKIIVWILAIGGIFEWARQSAKRQLVLLAGTATVVSGSTLAVSEISRNGPEAVPTPVIAQRTVTLPPPPVTTSATAVPTQSPPQASSTSRPPETRSRPTGATSAAQPAPNVVPSRPRHTQPYTGAAVSIAHPNAHHQIPGPSRRSNAPSHADDATLTS